MQRFIIFFIVVYALNKPGTYQMLYVQFLSS